MAGEQTDYDKKYQEDLERAQALSLESLALEEFKNKRLKELNKHLSSTSSPQQQNKTTGKVISISRASSLTETDSSSHVRYDRQHSKSRPRPGTSTTPVGSLLAPPPSSGRKTSFSSPTSDGPDLISFSSPPPTTSNILDFYNTQSSALMKFSIPAAVVQHQQQMQQPQQAGQQFNNNYSGTAFMPQYSMMQQRPIGWFLPQTPTSTTSSSSPPVSLYRSASSTSSNVQIVQQVPPVLPPKNVLKKSSPLKSTNGNNLIDLAQPDDKNNSVRVSILQEFDPILSCSDYASSLRTISPECQQDDCVSVCDSVYDEYDPYDFIYSGSGNNSLSDPMYAAVIKSENTPQSPAPPVPPRARNRMSTLEKRVVVAKDNKTKWSLLDNISKIDPKSNQERDSELISFYKMVYSVRNRHKFNQPDTNMGLIISPMVNYEYREGTSIKLIVHPDFQGADFHKALAFTCDVTSSVEHVTMQLTCDLVAPSEDNYTLKVWGFNEYLAPTTFLSDYEYIHNCIKLEEDVLLILIPDSKVDKSFARTLQDDNRDKELTFEDVITNENVSQVISYDKINILLEIVEKEMTLLEETAASSQNNATLQPQKVVQSVKCVMNLMGNLCTLEIMESIESLRKCTDSIHKEIMASVTKNVSNCCNKIRLALQNLIEMYCQAFKVDFEVVNINIPVEPIKFVPDISDSVLIRICAIYRPPPDWKHDFYILGTQIYHGMRPIGQPNLSQPREKTEQDQNWPARIILDEWVQLSDIPVSSLARESRLVLVIYGRTLKKDQENNNDNNSHQPQYEQEEIGWSSVQFFNYEGRLIQGSMVLSVWPKEAQYKLAPAPAPGTHPQDDHPMVGIEIAGVNAEFPAVPPDLTSNVIKGDFTSLDNQTQEQLLGICELDMFHKLPPDLREVLWEKRHYLYNNPEALPKVLLAAHSWEYTSLADLHGMLHSWKALKPIEALQLLLPTYPDMEVRKMAVVWIGGLSNDELVDYLPQLVVALRHETYENSPLVKLLLDRALRSPRFAHHLFWLLSHNLPGSCPQNSALEERDPVAVSEVRYHRRMKLLLRALLAICGEALRSCFLSQQFLVKEFNDIAENVQKTKESHRQLVLQRAMETINTTLQERPTSLPLSPTLRVSGVNVRNCSYFNSNTLPLKINFIAPDRSDVQAIYKVGDDLQQDMLTLQMVRLMDKLWLLKGLDLKMVTFNCVATGKKRGMIEMVTKAETLRKIQVEHGLTGSFKDKPIAEWLAKHNPSELEYGRAVENFTASCAGYCVVTYILGICDRHNDNIMLKTSGHLFHIDFGKFLGDAQMFGNFKRDRAPFVLTSDMAYVINGGDRPSEKFHMFVDLCCQAFNIVRNNRNLFLYLFTLMASSGIGGLTHESVTYVHTALLPGLSNPEAAANFARLIESSLKSWFTQFNFFLHNLAQLKFSGDHTEGTLLSFVPKTYSLSTDGRLTNIEVVNYKKRYDPDKYYVYVLRIYRNDRAQPMEIQRTYKEFCELQQKLCIFFPLAKLHSLSNGLHMGRSNIKQVAEKRYHEISLFIKSLFLCASEIAHSDLVYTFFHPLLRDQQYPDEFSKKAKDRRSADLKNESGRLKGQLKLSLQFSKGVFSVMVHHVRGLTLLPNGQEPSTYVKVYLRPDTSKTTKRKTKVVKRNCHPSFMEMLEYRMALDIIKDRRLQATVWNYDPLQENEFLGGVELDLSLFNLTLEITEWYPLGNICG